MQMQGMLDCLVATVAAAGHAQNHHPQVCQRSSLIRILPAQAAAGHISRKSSGLWKGQPGWEDGRITEVMDAAGSDVRTCQISTLTNHKQAFDHALPTRSCVEVGVGSSPAPAHWKTTVVSFKFAGDATCWKDGLTRSPPMQAAEAASSHSDGSTPSPSPASRPQCL